MMRRFACGAVFLAVAGCANGGDDRPSAPSTPVLNSRPDQTITPMVDASIAAGGMASVATDAGSGGSPTIVFNSDAGVDGFNIAFVTSDTRSAGDVGGLGGADRACNKLAAAAGLPGTYVALLSSSSVDARDRLAGARGWVRVDGRPIADTVEQLLDDQAWYPIALDENGEHVGSASVLTGSDASGQAETETCGDWTINDRDLVRGGAADGGRMEWISHVTISCQANAWHLYCFGVDEEQALGLAKQSGRRAFVSRDPWQPGAGLTDADEHCQTEADTADLPGSYKALLATQNASATSRFDLDGAPWVRTDGVVVVEEAADLVSENLLAPINVTASGTRSLSLTAVWTGSDTPDTNGVETCSSWMSTNGRTAVGSAARSSASDWFNTLSNTIECNATYAHLFCLQE